MAWRRFDRLVILGLVPLLGAGSVVTLTDALGGGAGVVLILFGAPGLVAGALAHRRGAAWEAPVWGVLAIASSVALFVALILLWWTLGPPVETPCGNGRIYC